MKRMYVLLAMALVLVGRVSQGQDQPRPTRQQVYKKVGEVELKMHLFEPAGHQASDRRAAIVFFFGGGWVGGRPNQFYPHAAHLAERGMLAMCAEYRVRKQHGTTPFECVQDGKSAIRWVRKNADNLGVDADRIAAAGGSAGGHVAAATGTVPGLNEPGEDLRISARPGALVLFNPVYDNGPEGYGHDRVKARYREISPLHNIDDQTPPAIVFLGTQDKLIPVATARDFQNRMAVVGVRSELLLFAGQPHGFFNFGRGGGKHYRETVAAMDGFLRFVKYLPTQSNSPNPSNKIRN